MKRLLRRLRARDARGADHRDDHATTPAAGFTLESLEPRVLLSADLAGELGDVAARAIGRLKVGGSAVSARVLAGARFGSDGVLGGGDDSFEAGTLGAVAVKGAAQAFIVAVGFNPADGAALFSLIGDRVELVPGLVTFDGRVITIDVTSLGHVEEGALVFQLLGVDGDGGT